MTREEASFILANIDRRVCDDELNEALDMAIKALEQEPCDNAVSRQDVLDLAKKGILISNGNYESVCKAINELPSVNPQPCEDAISRQAVLDMATTIQTDDFSGNEIIEVVDIDDVKALPSVNPQPKTGHWIDDMGLGYHVSICSNCNWRGHGDTCLIYKPKYCPNCGAKMVESQESEVDV